MEQIDELDELSTPKTFASKLAKDDNTVMILDALNLGFRFLHSGQLNFAEDYLKTVQSLAQSYKAGRVIVACDKGSSTYRKNIFPEYKANRKEKYELQTAEEKAKFERFFADFEVTLLLLEKHYPVLRYDGVEADDLAAWLVANLDYKQCWLISTDKDWDLLISDKVNRFSYITRKEITLANWPHDCSIENYIGLKSMQGDIGDNIKGVAGIGPKRANALLDTHGSIWNLIEAIPLDGKQKFIQELNKSKDLLLRNMELMDLISFCEDAIGSDNIKDIRRKLEIDT